MINSLVGTPPGQHAGTEKFAPEQQGSIFIVILQIMRLSICNVGQENIYQIFNVYALNREIWCWNL
mgnify:CR=1 FL=1